VAEKRANDVDARRGDQLERLKNDEIERVLQAAFQEELDMKRFNNEVARKSWDEALDFKKTVDRENSKVPDIDVSRCGMSSAVSFSGEDTNRVERLRAQKLQVRTWIQEQMAEKTIVQNNEKAEDMGQADVGRRIDEVREKNDKEEKEMMRAIRQKFAAENTQVMLDKRARVAEEKEWEKNAPSENLAIVTEDKNLAMDASGRIIRVDMFKGFTQAQQRRILQSNEEQLNAKVARDEAERVDTKNWALQGQRSMYAMERASQDEADFRSSRKAADLAGLRRQMEEQQANRKGWEKARFGAVGEGFFQAFGTSGR
jgi:hypothetical protein